MIIYFYFKILIPWWCSEFIIQILYWIYFISAIRFVIPKSSFSILWVFLIRVSCSCFMDAVSFYSQILNYFIIPSEFFMFTSVCFFWTMEGFSNAWWSLVVSWYLSMGHWKVGLKLCLPGLYVLVVGFTVGRTALALSLGAQLSVSVGLVAFSCETPANFLPRMLKPGCLHSGRWVWEWDLGAHGSVYQLSLSSPAFAWAPWLSTIPAPQFRSSLVRPQRRVNTQVSATVEVGIWVSKCFL